jgi:DNA-directed RNA polymerase specialized sigma subunit
MGKINIDEEKALIKRYQMTKNPLVYKELERKYSGIIQKVIIDSGLTRFLADKATIQAHAIAAFQKALDTYSESKNVQPNTYIINTINYALRNYKNKESSDVFYRPEQMNRKISLYHTAIQQMRTDPNADMSDTSIVKYVKSMKSAKGESLGKDFTRKDVKKIRENERTELMGNEIINAGSGEDIEVSEMFGNHATSTYDVIKKKNQETIIASILRDNKQLTLKQKNYLKRLTGIGRIPKAANESQARINSGVTTTEAYKAKQIMQEELKKRGMI